MHPHRSNLTDVSFYALRVSRITPQSAWGSPLLQGSPLPPTIRWIVFEIPPCGAPDDRGVSLSAESDLGLCPKNLRAF